MLAKMARVGHVQATNNAKAVLAGADLALFDIC